MTFQKSFVVVSLLLSLLGVIASGCGGDEQSLQEGESFVKKPCEQLELQKVTGATLPEQEANKKALIEKREGCAEGVKFLTILGAVLYTEKVNVNADDIDEFGMAWCAKQFQTSDKSNQFVGCQIGVDSGIETLPGVQRLLTQKTGKMVANNKTTGVADIDALVEKASKMASGMAQVRSEAQSAKQRILFAEQTAAKLVLTKQHLANATKAADDEKTRATDLRKREKEIFSTRDTAKSADAQTSRDRQDWDNRVASIRSANAIARAAESAAMLRNSSASSRITSLRSQVSTAKSNVSIYQSQTSSLRSDRDSWKSKAEDYERKNGNFGGLF